MPRVLMVEPGPDGRDLADVEVAIAPDGRAALDRMRRERFDAVVCDVSLEPLDGWCVLAAAGSWRERPRLVAVVADAGEAGRARRLGADLCVVAGTKLHARALLRSTKEKTTWPRPHSTSSRRTTRRGASA
jgi:CheY-like chemotaxis protein